MQQTKLSEILETTKAMLPLAYGACSRIEAAFELCNDTSEFCDYCRAEQAECLREGEFLRRMGKFYHPNAAISRQQEADVFGQVLKGL